MKKPDKIIAQHLPDILANGGGYIDTHHLFVKYINDICPCISTRVDSSAQIFLIELEELEQIDLNEG